MIVGLMLVALLVLSGCSDVDVASENLRKSADNFEVYRRVVKQRRLV